jgi:trimethylamine--corrinoid protein Co-methyltransferase
MRPQLRFLENELIEKIVGEARVILKELGVTLHNHRILSMLSDHGARVDKENHQVYFTDAVIDSALATVPSSFRLYDVLGNETHDFSSGKVHFTPGSAAINVLDFKSGKARPPVTEDYVKYAKLVNQLEHIASQSTALIPSDVHQDMSDSYRLYLSLLWGEKPTVTGAFTIAAFEAMRDLQLAVRGTADALKRKPLTVFSCCPTAPLKWSDVTSQNAVDCAELSIPVELISMPLSGFVAPVTLVGTLIQHTAETLSGVVILQLANPGTPVLYGGSPAIFDVRYETTPMGAIETQMIDCAYSEIGRYLGMPTQAYIGLSDAKQLDAQAGLESSMGATLAALIGINNVSGPGMLDFESCFSLEKLVVDNEICGMTLRLLEGIQPREDFPSISRFKELLNEKHLLISEHTRRYLREEHYFPGKAIDRAQRSRWLEEGGLTLGDRANHEVLRLEREYEPSRLDDSAKKELRNRMQAEGRRLGMDSLPGIRVD